MPAEQRVEFVTTMMPRCLTMALDSLDQHGRERLARDTIDSFTRLAERYLTSDAPPAGLDRATGRLGRWRGGVAMTDVVNNQQLEWWAAWIVATVLGGRPKRRDLPPAPPATHDFDVCLSDRVVALEVTRAAVREVRAQQAAIDSASWEAPGLTHNWTL